MPFDDTVTMCGQCSNYLHHYHLIEHRSHCKAILLKSPLYTKETEENLRLQKQLTSRPKCNEQSALRSQATDAQEESDSRKQSSPMSKRIEKQAKFGNREQLAQIAQKVAEAECEVVENTLLMIRDAVDIYSNVDFGMKMLSVVSNETATTVNNAREEIVRPPPKSAAPQIQHHEKLSSEKIVIAAKNLFTQKKLCAHNQCNQEEDFTESEQTVLNTLQRRTGKKLKENVLNN
ncbi:unnamed protein product, partial [Didymodactylos carnosus]